MLPKALGRQEWLKRATVGQRTLPTRASMAFWSKIIVSGEAFSLVATNERSMIAALRSFGRASKASLRLASLNQPVLRSIEGTSEMMRVYGSIFLVANIPLPVFSVSPTATKLGAGWSSSRY